MNMSTPVWTTADVPEGALRIGSEEHKRLFCRMLLDTFDPYKPAVIDWPKLTGDALARLTGLPFWDVAVETEGWASTRMQALADITPDPLIREAIALNAFEERRHKEVLQNMVRFYGIELGPEPVYPRPKHEEWAFIQTGYGECLDSFFAFGLFHAAKESGFFPPELVEVFEPVVREESRHILFFVNWISYTQANRGLLVRPWFALRRLVAIAIKGWGRLSLAKATGGGGGNTFTQDGVEDMGIDLSPRSFLELCLAENERRMSLYDARLLRPAIMPRLVRTVAPLLGRASASAQG
jgi:hypothetical protein